MEELLKMAGYIIVLGGAAEILRRGVLWVIGTIRKWSRLADDLLGEPPRPGLPNGRPGLMDRVAGIEERLNVLEELRSNGGNSVRDMVAAIARKTGAQHADGDGQTGPG